MDGYDASTYGERWADVYDHWAAGRELDVEPAVDLLTELAAGGRVLELAVGTGRVALPLARRGLEVHGIDASPAMVERLRSKPGGADLPVRIGDMADVDVEGSFRLIFVVFNTLFALTSQDEQVRCFRNVAARLRDDGVFVVEAFVPDPCRFDGAQTVRALSAQVDRVSLEVSRHDPVRQRIATSYLELGDDGVQVRPVFIRYAWPSELDLMARLAGLVLRERWQDWRRQPFTSASRQHVSVYARGG